jgi:hypothetical protein
MQFSNIFLLRSSLSNSELSILACVAVVGTRSDRPVVVPNVVYMFHGNVGVFWPFR